MTKCFWEAPILFARQQLGFIRHLKFGRDVALAFRTNHAKIWSLAPGTRENPSSSLSDVGTYLTVVMGVVEGQYQSNFRSCAQYQDVLEHVSYDLSLRYLADLKKWSSWEWLLNGELARKFSDIGSPPTYPYKTDGKIHNLNPTFIRYAHVAKGLQERFGSLEQFRVAEIGAGFGGQSAVSHEVLKLKNVTLFDLPEVNDLAKWFLSITSPGLRVGSSDGRSPVKTEVDLVISNYAFSELMPHVQESYFENLIQHSPRGFMLWNRLSETRLGGITAEAFVERIPNARLEPEHPLSFKGNVLVSWSP